MKLKESPQQTLDEFKAFMSEHDNNPPKDDIRRFVQVSCFSMNDFLAENGKELALSQVKKAVPFKEIGQFTVYVLLRLYFVLRCRITSSNRVLSSWNGSQMTGKKIQHFWTKLRIQIIANGLPI